MPISVLLVAAMARGAPHAARGVLDLTGWDFQRDGIVALDGEWAFFGNALIPADSLPDPGTAPQPAYVTVPGAWNDDPDVYGQSMGRYGFGTYWLRILLPPGLATAPSQSDRELAIFIPYAHTAYTVWVDGRPLASNGVVGRSSSEGKPAFRPDIARFRADGDTVDVVIHVSNYDFREGGLPRRLELGTFDQIALKQRRIEIMDGVFFGATLIMAIFFGGVYRARRDRQADGFFSAFLFLIAIRMLVTGDHLLARVTSGGIPWKLGLTIEYITAYTAPAVLLYYLNELFPKDVSPWVVRGWTAIAVLGSLASILLPGRLSSQLIPALLAILAVSVVYGVYVGVRAVQRGRPEARLFLFGLLASLTATAVTLLRYTGVAPVADLVPAGIVVLVVSQGLLLAVRWARTYQQTMVLAAENARMLETTQMQLKKLREYRRLMTVREENLRRRIAEMLHGRTQGRLFFIVRLIDQAERAMHDDVDAASGYLKAARNLLDQVREEDIRSTSRRLHPAAVGAGLIPAIESLLDTFDASYEIYFDVDPKVEARDQAEDGFRYDLRLGVYRIVEEGLNNIAHHAQASKIRLGLSLMERDGKEYLEITMTDDGVGFDPQRQSQGLGLQTIDARAGDLGGEWKLTGAPGAGATLWVSLPIRPNGSVAGRARHDARERGETPGAAKAGGA